MSATTRTHLMNGSARTIAEAIGSDDDALLDLVEDFMRTETGGTLDRSTGSASTVWRERAWPTSSRGTSLAT